MSGYVYFIAPEDWRIARVKIGRTRAGVANRLSALQTGSPFPLTVVGYVEGGNDLERLLHDTFESLRFHGEWFDLRGRLLALVSNLYFDRYGAQPYSRSEFDKIAAEVLLDATAPHECFCSPDEWDDSANAVALTYWLGAPPDRRGLH